VDNTTNTVLIHSVENIGLPYNNKHGTNLTTLSLPTSFITRVVVWYNNYII